MTEHARHAPLESVTGSSANGIAKYEESPVEGDDALSGRLNASPGGIAHETATLAMILAAIRPGLRADELTALVDAERHARALRAALDRAAAIDAEGVPASYRMLGDLADQLAGDVAAMRDRREWLDVEGKAA